MESIMKHTLATVFAAGLATTSASAVTLAYEGFDTISADGQNLPSLDRTGSSDFGWGDQWRFNAATALGITVDSPGLEFGDLATVGKLADSNFNGSSAGQYRRELDASYTVGTGTGERGEMWASWLTTWSGNTTGGAALQWFKLHNDNTEVISAGINNFGGVQASAQVDEWRLAVDGDPNAFTGIQALPGEVYQLSLRLSASGSDTLVELFVNSGGDRTLGSALATHTLTGAATFDQVRLQTLQTNITAEWDEIRIGESFSDVGLVPEPSSLALLGLGGLFVARRRRG